MATSFHQFSLPPGIQSGAGAQRVGAGTDQTGNLLNMLNAIIRTPEHSVHIGTVGGHAKRRFGSTTQQGGHAFDYPVHASKSTGNGQAYPMSKAGYLPGNGGGGQAGYGIERDPAHWTPAADVTDAQNHAFRGADYHSTLVPAEHAHYVDRTKETLQEQFQNQVEDYTRQRIQGMLEKGFSEEEIAAKLERERQTKIDQARNQPYNTNKLLEASLAKAMPTQLKEDFGNASVSPGLVPAKRNASSFQLAMGQGGKLARQKANQAMRHREAMSGQVSKIEIPCRKIAMSDSEILKDMMAASRSQVTRNAKVSIDQEQAVIDHQKMRANTQKLQEMAMMKAFGPSVNEDARRADPQHPMGENDKRGQYY